MKFCQFGAVLCNESKISLETTLGGLNFWSISEALADHERPKLTYSDSLKIWFDLIKNWINKFGQHDAEGRAQRDQSRKEEAGAQGATENHPSLAQRAAPKTD